MFRFGAVTTCLLDVLLFWQECCLVTFFEREKITLQTFAINDTYTEVVVLFNRDILSRANLLLKRIYIKILYLD